MKDIYIKVHKTIYENVIAVCDKELIGKTFKDKEIELKVNEHFYKGELLEEDEIVHILKNSTIVNIMGKRSVSLALKIGLIEKENIIRIKGVPHAQFTKIIKS